ncbi:hypothetical protein C2S51_030425 [Perilla frutescens var. frutescens]|nr:hypothetical protein C2S51_030425 [Perilla frutescens var. frutescens]
MAKGASLTAMLVLLQIICADAGLDAACKKAQDAKFCASLLKPYAAQLADNNPVKAGLAAMNATLRRVDELREYMVHEAVQEQTSPEELDTLSHCLSNVGNGEGALEVAVQLLNQTEGAERDELLKMIESAKSELTICLHSLTNHKTIQQALREALRLTEESLLACSVAQALLP